MLMMLNTEIRVHQASKSPLLGRSATLENGRTIIASRSIILCPESSTSTPGHQLTYEGPGTSFRRGYHTLSRPINGHFETSSALYSNPLICRHPIQILLLPLLSRQLAKIIILCGTTTLQQGLIRYSL